MALLKRAETSLRCLTKSLVKKALSCPRKLVYATNDKFAQKYDLVEDPLLRHLSNEGERFGEYCKSLFPHGYEIGKDAAFERLHNAPMSESDLVDETRRLLMGEEPIVLFEGAVRDGLLFVRPDILVKTIPEENGQTELKMIEVKSKSWDSRHSVESKMLTSKKAIKSSFLPYIQDVAFQTLVLRNAFPDFHISSWLMMPDRAKKLKCISEDIMTESIDDSVASLVNIDDLVDKALTSKVSYPGSKKSKRFTEVIADWSESLNTETNKLKASIPPPIGSHCMSCEYRLNDENKTKALSGFDLCWQEATGVTQEMMEHNNLVADIYSPTQKLMQTFLTENKYTFSDLTANDFGLNEDGTLQDDEDSDDKIHRSQRQWFQVQSATKDKPSEESSHYIMKEGLKSEMEQWQYPLHFIDFETISPALPYFDGMSPYEIVCFQFSHHILEKNHDGTVDVRHETQFLHTTRGVCPNQKFLEALYNAVGCVVSDGGTVFRWSAHETTVLKSILSSPQFAAPLSQNEIETLSALLPDGSHPMVDLFELARHYFYVDGSGGSSSIKRLLRPTMNASAELRRFYGTPTYNSKNFQNIQWYQVDEESGLVLDPYKILSRFDTDNDRGAIAVGGAAAAAYHELQSNSNLTEEDRSYIHASLLRYCELDTLSMAMFVQAWQAFAVEDEGKSNCNK